MLPGAAGVGAEIEHQIVRRDDALILRRLEIGDVDVVALAQRAEARRCRDRRPRTAAEALALPTT